MTTLEITLLVLTMLAAGLFCHYLDAKYNWQLSAWFYGKPVNPFDARQTVQATPAASKDAEIASLKARIATLEAIVTEPAFELNQQLNQLRKEG
ncbi:hypothetical protein [Alteromonas gilva]|uniref:Uncharacterized protein n=1 Tax=Alteromonas gilva TaxID=2987522 RepID=A0ABT5KWT0_9ALTE|nr:hypothetical protein [Alteromonas gilva]MDC8829227.1 hypothetical protein [Alteromonas gilva]